MRPPTPSKAKARVFSLTQARCTPRCTPSHPRHLTAARGECPWTVDCSGLRPVWSLFSPSVATSPLISSPHLHLPSLRNSNVFPQASGSFLPSKTRFSSNDNLPRHSQDFGYENANLSFTCPQQQALKESLEQTGVMDGGAQGRKGDAGAGEFRQELHLPSSTTTKTQPSIFESSTF